MKNALPESISEAKRLIKQGAIDVNGAKVTEDIKVTPETIPEGSQIRIGKRHLFRVTWGNDRLSVELIRLARQLNESEVD